MKNCYTRSKKRVIIDMSLMDEDNGFPMALNYVYSLAEEEAEV